MRLRLVGGQRPYPIPRAAVFSGALLVALGVVAAALPWTASGPVICPFRAVTGLRCPTCGLMTVAHSLLRGEVARALAINPFDTVFLLLAVPAAAGLWAANRARGFAVRISMSRNERRCAWAVLALITLANWVYVLATGR